MDLGFLTADFLINIALAIATVVLTFWLSGFLHTLIVKVGLRYESLDDTLFSFLGSVSRYLVLAVGLIFVLDRFGIQTTSLVAVLGAASLAVGLAFQGTLSNIAAGVMIMIFRPFKLGDYVTASGHSGTVSNVKLFTTELTDIENVLTIVPNAQVWGTSIVNYSYFDERRLNLTFGVSYDSDINKAMAVVTSIVDADARIDSSRDVFVAVTNLGASSVDITARAWCDADDFWGLKFDLLKGVKEALDKEGIEIPFPTMTHYTKSVG